MNVIPDAAQDIETLRIRQNVLPLLDRIGARLTGDANDVGYGEVRLDRAETLADLVCLVGLEAMQGELVFLGEYRDRLHAEFVGRAKHANGDLGPVGDQNLVDRHSSPLRKSP